jgi:Skp family chaperone for outer membrane proteins
MRIALTAALVGAATAALAGMAGPAFAVTPAPPRTVESLKAQVDAKAEHITSKMQALQTRLATRPKLAAAMTTLQADISKTLADTATWRKQVDAATTKAGVRAADPAHQVVKADLAKLHSDLATAKGAITAAH